MSAPVFRELSTVAAVPFPDTASRSRRRLRARFARNVPPSEIQRAQGMPGAQCARSLACEIKKHTSIVTTVTPETPGIPRAMVLRLTSRSPRRPGFVVTVACASSRRLDANPGASEPHDFAVRFSIIRPARYCSPDAAASTASRPAFRDVAQRPSVGQDVGSYGSDLGQARSKIFLQSPIAEAVV